MYKFLKRLMEIVLSFWGILLLTPLMIFLSFLIKITSPGKIVFVDRRVGKGNKMINVYKFRTMYSDAESNIERYLTEEQLDIYRKERKIDNDPRITKIGKFLRKTSLDELPQLFNVITGTLSLVGCRPLSRLEVETWFNEEEQKELLSLTPGVTGYWQAYGRSDVTFESLERQKMDLYYVRNFSFILDVKILFKTVLVVFIGKGAK